MSFADLESGRPLFPKPKPNAGAKLLPPPSSSSSSSSHSVASGLFQITTAVSSFQRLVNSLGTPKDTLKLRQNLHELRVHIGELVKDTSAKLQQASESDHSTEASRSKKIADAKLAKDFQYILKEFQKAQRLAAERETAYSPFDPQVALPSSCEESRINIISDKTYEQQVQVNDSRRQEVAFLDNEIVFNEAIIEEREQGIQEIQQQIGQVNEIFKDLALLVHDQGVMIDDIDSNIQKSVAATAEAKNQLTKASKIQRSNSSLRCLLLVIFGIVLLIMVIVFVA